MTRTSLGAGPTGGGGPHMHPAVWGPRLARILESQRDLCVTLEALSRQQAELIALGDTDGLLRVLGERQGVVDEVARLSEELEPLRGVWEAGAASVEAAVRSRITSVVEEIGRLMETIGARDEADSQSLEERRSTVARELGDISRGRGALAAYAAARPGHSGEDRRG